eukprot:1035415-Prymnesium_polylepis.1
MARVRDVRTTRAGSHAEIAHKAGASTDRGPSCQCVWARAHARRGLGVGCADCPACPPSPAPDHTARMRMQMGGMRSRSSTRIVPYHTSVKSHVRS